MLLFITVCFEYVYFLETFYYAWDGFVYVWILIINLSKIIAGSILYIFININWDECKKKIKVSIGFENYYFLEF